MKKLLTSLLALCMLLALLPTSALGEEPFDMADLELEELLPETVFEEDLPAEEQTFEPIPEELPELPAGLEEVPLSEAMEETEAFEARKLHGTWHTSNFGNIDEIILNGDLTLIVNKPYTLKSITGADYNLTIEGDCTLTINNPDGEGIHVKSFTSTSPLYVDTYDDAIKAEENISIQNNLTLHTVEGRGLYARDSVSVLNCIADITADHEDAGIYAGGGEVTLSANITVRSGGFGVYSHKGITIYIGSVTIISTSDAGYFDQALYTDGKFEMQGGSLTASARRYAIYAEEGIVISPLLMILSPENGKVAYRTIYDSRGDEAAIVRIDYPVKSYVERCYRVILSREGEPDGVAFWTTALEMHQAAGADIVAQFCGSPEFLGKGLKSNEITYVLYEAMLDREPDADGLNYWADLLGCGCSCNLAINGFSGSAEFKNICDKYGIIPGTVALETRDQNPMVTKFISRCYYLALDRLAFDDPEGTNYWTGQLLSRAQTPQQVARSFLYSEEFAGRKLDDEEFVTTLYRLYMGHEPEPEGLAYWVGVLEAGTPRAAVAEAFGNTPEFLAIVQSYGL